MRLMQAMAGRRPGGAEAFFVRLARALGETELDQRLLVRRGAACTSDLRAHGIQPAELPFGGALDLRTAAHFRRAVADFDPDVILTWMNRASRFCPRAPVEGHRFVHIARLGGYYDLKYYRRCDHLVANTHDIVEYVCRHGWARTRAHYLPNFVDAGPAAPVPRGSLDTPSDAPLLLALGRLHPNKGFDVLIHALVQLPGVVLWLAGTGPLAAALESLAARRGVGARVRFLGWRRDTAALLAAADVLVCPSRHEPLGNVVIEAWAHRTPVVAAAAKGPAALLRDGENGLLVPVEDADALAAAIARMMAAPELAARLAAAGRSAFEAAFSEAVVVPRYLAFFDSLAGPRSA
jgi:glycosyltransferase involved in cell wall biosynthesis